MTTIEKIYIAFIWVLAMIFISCGGSKTSTPSNNSTPTPTPSPGGNNPPPSALCGPYNANATSSSGAAPPYSDNIIDLLGQSGMQSINMCMITDSTSTIGYGITYVQISADTLYIWADPTQNVAMVSSFASSDTTVNDDHFEFLGSVITSGGSGGAQSTVYIPRLLNTGYQLSQTDLSQFIYSYSDPIYLSNTQNGNNLGNFLGKTGYIAFRVYTAQNYEYGWVKLQLTSTYQLAVYEVVLNTNFNSPLTIGQYQ